MVPFWALFAVFMIYFVVNLGLGTVMRSCYNDDDEGGMAFIVLFGVFFLDVVMGSIGTSVALGYI